jgi:hypothetical protein
MPARHFPPYNHHRTLFKGKKQTMRTRILILFGLLMILAGCNRGDVTDIQRDANGGADVTYKITESEINTAISSALAASANPLLRNPTVDLQPGQIVIKGERDRLDGSGRISGSVTLTLTVQNGALLAQITKADIEGWDASDARIAEFNQRLTDDFTRRANRDNKQITFTSATITDTDVELVFNVKRT